MKTMLYVLEPKKCTWGKVPLAPRELVDKQVRGIPLQQSDIPPESVLKGRFALPDICRPTSGFVLELHVQNFQPSASIIS